MTGWTITVKNETLHDDVVFLLFVDNTNLPGYFTNIFFRSPTVGPGGSRDIEIDPKLYGVCGIAQGSLKPGISVRNAQPRLLRANPDQPDAATCSAVGDGFVFTEEVTSMSVLGEGQIGLKVSSFSSDVLRKYPPLPLLNFTDSPSCM